MKSYVCLVALALVSICGFADDYKGGGSEHAPHPKWGYRSQHQSELSVPEAWGDVAATCGHGQTQSPIDIRMGGKGAEVDRSLQGIEFSYVPTTMEVFHNRHTVQATDRSKTNSVTFEGKRYELRNVHYHTKSEHLIDGEQFDVEVHMVHEGEGGKLLVLGVLVDVGGFTSEYGGGLAKMIFNVQGRANEYVPVNLEIDPTVFLPRKRSYATYLGSLTTPPCTEGVRWIVFTQKETMSFVAQQIFRNRKLRVGFSNFRPHFTATPAHEPRLFQQPE